MTAQPRRMSLREHRENLTHIDPTLAEISRLQKTIEPHIRACGYVVGKKGVPKRLKKIYINLILETQDYKPFFWIESDLPFCWNAPKNFDKKYIVYEWGHLLPRGDDDDNVHTLENLCLMSSRCNNQIQSGMPIKDLILPFRGSLVGNRIDYVLKKRTILFKSTEWRKTKNDLSHYRSV